MNQVKNITVSVPDEVYRVARIRAAERGTSVSAMVREFLSSIAEREAEFARLEEQQRLISNEIQRFRAAGGVEREELHDRAIR